MVLNAIANTKHIYFMDLNSVPVDCEFLRDLMTVLFARNSKRKSEWKYCGNAANLQTVEFESAVTHFQRMTGPEILDLENMPVFSKRSRAEAVEVITCYIQSNVRNLKWLKLGYFHWIDFSIELAEKLRSAVLQNTHLVTIDVELEHLKVKQEIDRKLKQNKRASRRKRKLTI